jgi:hypothetical protein
MPGSLEWASIRLRALSTRPAWVAARFGNPDSGEHTFLDQNSQDFAIQGNLHDRNGEMRTTHEPGARSELIPHCGFARIPFPRPTG